MAISKQKKAEIISEIRKPIGESESLAFINFHGLTVAGAGELKKLLKVVGAKYRVVKKTLLKRVLEEAGFLGETPELDGEVAVIFSGEDSLAPTRIVSQFAKKNNVVKLLGGVFEKKFLNLEEATAMANIPSRQVLLAQFVNVINSPIQGLVIALNERTKKLQAN